LPKLPDVPNVDDDNQCRNNSRKAIKLAKPHSFLAAWQSRVRPASNPNFQSAERTAEIDFPHTSPNPNYHSGWKAEIVLSYLLVWGNETLILVAYAGVRSNGWDRLPYPSPNPDPPHPGNMNGWDRFAHQPPRSIFTHLPSCISQSTFFSSTRKWIIHHNLNFHCGDWMRKKCIHCLRDAFIHEEETLAL